MDIIRTVYYIHSPWRAIKNFCCFICVSYGPYTLLQNDSFFTFIRGRSDEWRNEWVGNGGTGTTMRLTKWQKELIPETRRKKRSVIFRKDNVSGRARVATDEQRVLSGRWKEMRLWRLGNCEKFVGKRKELYLMREVILSQWREHRMGVMWQDLRAINDNTSKRVLDLLEKLQKWLKQMIVCFKYVTVTQPETQASLGWQHVQLWHRQYLVWAGLQCRRVNTVRTSGTPWSQLQRCPHAADRTTCWVQTARQCNLSPEENDQRCWSHTRLRHPR